MQVGRFCRSPVVTVTAELSVREAAQRMDRHGVGTVVVVDSGAPVGVLTDRDIALEVLCNRLDAEAVTVGEVAHRPVATVGVDTWVREAAALLRAYGLRRLPVVDGDGKLAGLISVDDLLQLTASRLASIGEVLAAQAPVERPAEEEIQTIDHAE